MPSPTPPKVDKNIVNVSIKSEKNIEKRADTTISSRSMQNEENKPLTISNIANKEQARIFAALANGESFNDGYHIETILDEKNYRSLISPQGINVISPGKIKYNLHQDLESEPITVRAILKHEDAEQTNSESKEKHQQRLALTIINMIENVLSHGTEIHMKTSSAFEAKIAKQYINSLKEEKGMAIDSDIQLREENPNLDVELKHDAERIFNQIKPSLYAGLDDAPWYIAATNYRNEMAKSSDTFQL